MREAKVDEREKEEGQSEDERAGRRGRSRKGEAGRENGDSND